MVVGAGLGALSAVEFMHSALRSACRGEDVSVQKVELLHGREEAKNTISDWADNQPDDFAGLVLDGISFRHDLIIRRKARRPL